MSTLSSDIDSLETYFRGILNDDEELEGFLYETDDDTSNLSEASKSDDWGYPALVLFSPTLEIDDNGSGLLEAQQTNSFAVLARPADRTRAAKNAAAKQAQQAVFRVIKRLRTDALTNYLFRIDEGVKWTISPMSNVGNDNAVGWLVDFKIKTQANAQIGRS